MLDDACTRLSIQNTPNNCRGTFYQSSCGQIKNRLGVARQRRYSYSGTANLFPLITCGAFIVGAFVLISSIIAQNITVSDAYETDYKNVSRKKCFRTTLTLTLGMWIPFDVYCLHLIFISVLSGDNITFKLVNHYQVPYPVYD